MIIISKDLLTKHIQNTISCVFSEQVNSDNFNPQNKTSILYSILRPPVYVVLLPEILAITYQGFVRGVISAD